MRKLIAIAATAIIAASTYGTIAEASNSNASGVKSTYTAPKPTTPTPIIISGRRSDSCCV